MSIILASKDCKICTASNTKQIVGKETEENIILVLGKLSKLKSGETLDWVQSGNDPLKILRNKLNMKNIGTKSINMSDIMVYLAMFSTIIDQILCIWVLIR